MDEFGDADPLLEHRDGDDYEVRPQVVPPAVCCRTGLPLCFLVIGIQTSQISISLSLLMISERSLMPIASLTLLVYQCDSRSINFTSFQVVGARRNGGGLGWILKTEQHSFYLNINANVVSFRAFLSATFI